MTTHLESALSYKSSQRLTITDNSYPTIQAYTNDTTITDNSYPTKRAYTNATDA